MSGIDWTAIRNGGPLAAKYATEELRKSIEETGTFDLEETYLNHNAGGSVILATMARALTDSSLLPSMPRFKFKILRMDALDTKPKPGEKFRVCVGPKTRRWRDDGREVAMGTDHLNAMAKRFAQRGKKDDDPNKWEEYVIDQDMCITVGFTTAMLLMVHHSSAGEYHEKIEVRRIDQSTKQEVGEPWQVSYNWLVEYVRPDAEVPASEPLLAAGSYRKAK